MTTSPRAAGRPATATSPDVAHLEAERTAAVWRTFRDQLRGFIARRVPEPADVDDIVQDVFVRVHRHLGTLERTDRLVPWLLRTTRHAITDYYRVAGRARARTAALDAAADVAAPVGDDALGASAADAVTARRELAGCLRPMLETLPAPYHEALTLVELDGLTQAAAAARTGVSVSGMKSRVQRGRARLKAALLACCRVSLDAGGEVLDYTVRHPSPCGCGVPDGEHGRHQRDGTVACTAEPDAST